MYSSTNLPVRPIEVLRELTYDQLNSAEMDALRSKEPEVFKNLVEALDGKPVAATESETPAEPPQPQPNPGYYKNGVWTEVIPRIQFQNGIRV